MNSLRKAVLDNEEWLKERVRDYALARGYTRYTSTLVSAWRISIAGLSDALLQAVDNESQPLDFGPDDTFRNDPASRFAVQEAKLHRERGISLAMFLRLLKYYRQTYLDLVREMISGRSRAKAMDVVARFFDRVEVGIAQEWSACERDALLQELQDANRNLANEKNKYLTVFESLALPVFLFDEAGRLLHANHAATRWLRLRTPPGLEYYLERSAMADRDAAKVEIPASEILPDLAADIMDCCGQPDERVQLERTIRLGDEERYYIVTLGRQLDFSGKFAGVVVTLEDITERRMAEQDLQAGKERLSETARKRLKQLKSANSRLEREVEQRAALEEALRKGAQFYRAIVEDQTELVCRFTPDCVLTFVNQAYCRFRGKTEDQLLGASFLPAIPGSHREAFLAHLRAITPEAPLRVVEHAATAADGSVRWQRWTDRGFFDADGNVIEYQSVGSDITDRHRAEEDLKRLNVELESRVVERTRAAEDKAERLGLEIAHRKTIEEELRENRAMLRQILDSVPQSIFWKDADSVFLGCNQVFARTVGFAGPEELVGRTDYDLPVPREEAEAYRADDAAVMASKRPKLHILEPLQQADGSRLWVDTSKMPLLDAGNNVRGVLGVFEDVTEKKQAEEALRQSEELFRNLFERHAAVKLILDPDTGAILDANRAAEAFYGWSGEQLRSMRIQDINTLPPEEVRAEMERVRSNERVYFEFRHRRADGAVRDVAVFSSKFTAKGRDILHSIIHDITQRKQAEEALRESEEKHRALFESMTEGACILDAVRDATGELADYRIVDVNPAYSKIMGVPRKRAVGALVRELYELALPPDREAFSRVLDSGEPATFETSIPEMGMHFHVSSFRMRPERFVAMFQDITQRKLAEEALRRSEAFQKAIIACTPLALYSIDREGRVLTWNDSARRIFGWSAGEVVGAALPIVPAGRQDEYARLRERVWQGETLDGLELVRRRKDGATIHISLSASRIHDAEGGIIGILSAAQDVTDRKRAEDALRRRLELEQVMAGVSGQLIGMRFEEIERDLPPLLAIVSSAIGADMAQACRMEEGAASCLTSWSSEDGPGDAICPNPEAQTHPWVMSRLRNLESMVVRRFEDIPPDAAREGRSFTERGIRSLLIAPLAKGEALAGCLAFATVREPRDWTPEDVSFVEAFARILASAVESARLERVLRFNERRYFDLIDNLSEGLWSVDLEGRTGFVNRSMAGMLGYEAGEILGKDPRAFMTEETARDLTQKLAESRQGIPHRHTMELVHKDGHRVYVAVSGAPMRNEQGAIVGSMALMSDLSKERLLQLQLIQAQRLEAIGQLAAGIAHEINTPTQYVDNNVQFLRGAYESLLSVLREHDVLLKEARDAPALADAVRRVEAARQAHKIESILADIPGAFDDTGDGLQRISLIVDSVKRFAHPSQGEMAPADLNDALRSTIVVARNEWKYVAEVATELDPSLPLVPCVLSDINQVVLNLIVNAAHAIAAAPGRAPDAKGRITVRTRAEGGWAVIEVSDTGPGIPQGIRSRIFDPFFTTKEVGKGTGQGLAIARTVVAEKHRGSIMFETEEGKGATFFVRLPLQQKQEKDGE